MTRLRQRISCHLHALASLRNGVLSATRAQSFANNSREPTCEASYCLPAAAEETSFRHERFAPMGSLFQVCYESAAWSRYLLAKYSHFMVREICMYMVWGWRWKSESFLETEIVIKVYDVEDWRKIYSEASTHGLRKDECSFLRKWNLSINPAILQWDAPLLIDFCLHVTHLFVINFRIVYVSQ